jgi:hypothetical protein
MKVTAFYYLDYPDECPIDPVCAATEMYVEVGGEESTTDEFWCTYSFYVITYEFLEREFIQRGRPLIGRSVMIVPTLEDQWMARFLNEHVDRLNEWADAR